MRRDEALRILAEHREEIVAFGVSYLAIFGSVARDEAGPDSDVDILVEFGVPADLFDLVRLQQYLERLLGRPVDLGTPASLRPGLRAKAAEEALRVA